ncbi:MAG: hypothetical protein ACRENE_02140, partial [Polyangiaceae bacterium]
GKGGIFVQTNDPMPAGKQVSVEIQIPGQLATWSAVGRVRWNRAPGNGGGRPPGMGIAFIDVDNAVLVAIGKILARGPLVERTHSPPPAAASSSAPPAGAPARERTVLGVGQPAQAPVVATPIVAAAPSREKTMLGVAPEARPALKSEPPAGETTKVHAVVRLPPEATRGDEPHPASEVPEARAPEIQAPETKAVEAKAPEAPRAPPERELSSRSIDDKWPDEPPASSEPERVPTGAPAIAPDRSEAPPAERSLAVDLVTEKKAPVSQRPDRSSIDSLVPAGVPRGRGGRAFLYLVVVAAAAGAYVQRDRLRPVVAPYIAKVMALTAAPGAGSPPTTATPTPTTSTPTPTSTSTPTSTPLSRP